MLEPFYPRASTDPSKIMKVHGLFTEAHGGEARQISHRQALRELVVNGEEAHYFTGAFEEEDIAVMALYFHRRTTAMIEALAVDKALRGRQIGSRALGELIDRAVYDGVHHIKLVALPGSVRFYEQAGFEVAEPGETHIDMVKRLND